MIQEEAEVFVVKVGRRDLSVASVKVTLLLAPEGRTIEEPSVFRAKSLKAILAPGAMPLYCERAFWRSGSSDHCTLPASTPALRRSARHVCSNRRQVATSSSSSSCERTRCSYDVSAMARAVGDVAACAVVDHDLPVRLVERVYRHWVEHIVKEAVIWRNVSEQRESTFETKNSGSGREPRNNSKITKKKKKLP